MDDKERSLKSKSMDDHNNSIEDGTDFRRGPWTVEEDFTLINYIAIHGEGRWNSLARCAGLKRTGKSCRLRWLNYLRPDVRRGNITLEEQLLILELHSRWGNRWSKIAQYLPGRTDNEIKNYWRTRVQKHAKQLKCDVNSKKFKDAMKYLWMPRLVERIQAAASSKAAATSSCVTSSADPFITSYGPNDDNIGNDMQFCYNNTWEHSSAAMSPASTSDLTEYYNGQSHMNPNPEYNPVDVNMGQIGNGYCLDQNLIVQPTLPENYFNDDCKSGRLDEDIQGVQEHGNFRFENGGSLDSLWNIEGGEDFWLLLQQHLNGGSF